MNLAMGTMEWKTKIKKKINKMEQELAREDI